MLRNLTWQDHFDLVREYVDEFFLDDVDVRKLIPGELEFHVDDLDRSINAYASLLTERNYRIVFNAGLIKALTTEAYLIVERSPLIFRGVDRSNERSFELCHLLLMFTWIDFIFHHELAHIYCGHLKLVAGDAKWRELKSKEEVETLPINHYQLQRLEAHADRFAAGNLLAQFASHYSTDCERIYGKQDAGRFLKDYLLAIFYLFKLFEETAGRENYDEATHPAPFVRANVFWYWLKQSYPAAAGLVPPLSDDELQRTVYTAFGEFCSVEYHFTLEDIDKRTLEVSDFMDTVPEVLHSLGLSTQVYYR